MIWLIHGKETQAAVVLNYVLQWHHTNVMPFQINGNSEEFKPLFGHTSNNTYNPALQALCVGNPQVTDGFLSQRPLTRKRSWRFHENQFSLAFLKITCSFHHFQWIMYNVIPLRATDLFSKQFQLTVYRVTPSDIALWLLGPFLF